MKIARKQKRKYAQADQRATSLASRFHFSKSKSFLRVLVWRSEATPLVYDKHTSHCHTFQKSLLPIN